jgi:hypothetical protein
VAEITIKHNKINEIKIKFLHLFNMSTFGVARYHTRHRNRRPAAGGSLTGKPKKSGKWAIKGLKSRIISKTLGLFGIS